MIVSSLDSKIIQFEIDFGKIKRNNPPLFIKEGQSYRSNPDYKPISYSGLKKKYILERLFNEVGYEEYLIYCYKNNLESEEFLPCESVDSQCSLYCRQFNNCPLGK